MHSEKKRLFGETLPSITVNKLVVSVWWVNWDANSGESNLLFKRTVLTADYSFSIVS